MTIFLTGATGYVGSVIAEKLQLAGHRVVALARSQESNQQLQRRGIQTIRGSLDEPALLTESAHQADGVIHAGFMHHPDGFMASMESDHQAVQTMLNGLRGSNKPLIFTSGTGLLGDTRAMVFDETMDIYSQDRFPPDQHEETFRAANQRMQTERSVLQADGIRGVVVRPPNIYGRSDGNALITHLKAAAQRQGAVPFLAGSAQHGWSFVHVDDLADLYVLALEGANQGDLFYGSAEQGLTTKAIAVALSQSLSLEGATQEVTMPQLSEGLGNPFLAHFWSWNNQSSGQKARTQLGWQPHHTAMLNELASTTK